MSSLNGTLWDRRLYPSIFYRKSNYMRNCPQSTRRVINMTLALVHKLSTSCPHVIHITYRYDTGMIQARFFILTTTAQVSKLNLNVIGNALRFEFNATKIPW